MSIARIITFCFFASLLTGGAGFLQQCSKQFVSSFTGSSRAVSIHSSFKSVQVIAMSSAEIEVVNNPTDEQLSSLGVFNWSTWGCGISNFPWTYDEQEIAYILEGEVTVTPSDGRKSASFGKGDLVTFPAGMSCNWDVKKAVSKHYRFG